VTDDFAYRCVNLILCLHDQIVTEGDTTEPGVRSEDAIGSALQYISEGFFGEVPETIHEKSVHLMRLLVAGHPFVDGNKRTALRSVVVFYMLNGHTFDYGDEIRASCTGSQPMKRRSTRILRSSTSARVPVATDKRTH